MRTLFLCAIVACCAAAPQALAQPVGLLGVAGDSMSNEYFEFSFSYAKSWPELLAEGRGINLGPTAAQAGVGDWNDLRGWGYQNNYARPGSTSDALVKEGSPTKLASAVAERGLTHVVICASGNDMAPWNSFVYIDFYNDLWSQRRLDSWADMSVANIREAVQIVHHAGAKVVLVNMPDFNFAPVVHNAYPEVTGRERATAVVRRVNNGLRAVGQEFQIPVVDLFALSRAIFGTNAQPRESLDIGGVPIQLNLTGDATHQTNAFVEDGLHLGTAIQALWANAIITGLNTGYNTQIPTFTEAEILAFIGAPTATHNAIESLPAQIGAYSLYVNSVPCAADFDANGVLNSVDIFGFVNAWFVGGPGSDFDNSGTIDSTDIFAYLSAWMNGC